MLRIACHVLRSPERQADALLAQLAAEPVDVSLWPAIPGNISAARRQALAASEAPLQCWVDDDDRIEPGIFARLQQALEQQPHACGAFCKEAHVNANGQQLALRPASDAQWSVAAMLDQHPFVHHIALLRREAVLPYLDEIQRFPRVGDQLLLWLASRHGPWCYVPTLGYYWTRHAQQITADRSIAAELAAARDYARQRLALTA